MFKLFFKHVCSLSQHTEIEEPSLPRKRRAPAWFEIGEGACYHDSDVEDHYRRQGMFPNYIWAMSALI